MQQATSYLQGMPNPFGGVLESYGQGQVLRQNSDLLKAQQAEQARKIAAQQALETIDWNDKGAIARTVAQFPEYTKGAKDYYDALEQKEQQAVLADMSKSIASIDSGRPDIAVQNMRDKANAYRDANNEEKAEEYSQMAEWMAKDPVSARKALMMNYAVLSPDKSGANFKSYTDGNIAEDKAPHEIAGINATTGATNATANKTNTEAVIAASDGLSAAAMVGDPELFKQKVDMFARAGAIPVEHANYLDALMKLPTEQATLALENYAKGNPEIAKAIMASDTSKYVSDNTLAGTKYSSDNSLKGTVYSSDNSLKGTIYSSDNTLAGTQYSSDNSLRGSMYNTDATSATAQRRLAFDAQQAALKANEAELKEAGGKMYFVNKKGEIYPALDANGNHLSGKTDATTVKTQREETQRLDRVDAILPEIKKLLPSATGSKVGSWIDSAAGSVGYTTDGAAATAQLQTLAGQLVALMPKMSGPQSDKDVEMYKQMAGNLGDPTKTVKQRQAALKTIEMLNNKYRTTNKATSSGAPTGGNTTGYGDLFN